MKKGVLPPGVKLEKLTNKKQPRCQWVVEPKKEGEKFGYQCPHWSCTGRPYCVSHGGRSGRPPVTGTQSKYSPVPKDLRERFETSLKDAEMLNLSSNIALIAAEIAGIRDPALERGYFELLEMKSLLGLMESHAALVKQEQERRLALGMSMDIRDVLVMISYITDLIQKNVKDGDARRKIGAGLRKIVGEIGVEGRARGAVDTGGISGLEQSAAVEQPREAPLQLEEAGDVVIEQG